MGLFVMIIRKMVQNKWLVSSMFFGILMTVALVGTLPIYSEAILSRMLVKDLQNIQVQNNIYPASHWSTMNFYHETPEKRLEAIKDLDRYMKEEAAPSFGIPVKELVIERRTQFIRLIPENGVEDEKRKDPVTSLRSLSGLEAHIKLTDGRMPSNVPVDGVYEVLMTEAAMNWYQIVLGSVYQLVDEKIQGTVKIKPVGLFTKKQDDDPYFRNTSLSDLTSVFIVNEQLFDNEFLIANKIPVTVSGWFFILDYTKMELRNVDQFLASDQGIKAMISSKKPQFQTELAVPALKTLTAYFDRAKQLNKLMWSLNVPVLIMLGFYMFMVSNLIIDRQKNEIAILRSRGASRLQIMLSFALEGLLLCAIAWAIGPLIGIGLTKMLGASNGFLEFVQRSRMTVRLNGQAYVYGGIAAAISWIMMLVPVILAMRVTIVGHKQQLARVQRTPFWHKIFLDVILLGISIYGLYTIQNRLKVVNKLGLDIEDLQIDNMQFIMPALFVLGSGLFLLRLYPLALKLVYWIGRKWWPPSLYATLIQVGRSNSQYQFLMVFLIMTIAIGVFSAGVARTLNTNTEERIRYGNGADFIAQAQWPNDAPPAERPRGQAAEVSKVDSMTPKVTHYLEPSFEPFQRLAGVEQAAKVFIKNEALFTVGDQSGMATLIGIDTDEFGRAAWFPKQLLDHPFYEYLNLMAQDSRAVLISKTLADQRGIGKGDTIYAGWQNVKPQPFVVYGIIDYFPTFNPNPPLGSVDAANNESKQNAPMLIVGHLSRIQFQLALEPYQVWLKMKPGASTAELFNSIKEENLRLTSIVNTREELAAAKNDPFLMALNGILTLGFIISILISFIGFLLYWILSLKGRTLQNGIMRAVGLSLRQLIGMLALEQLLTSGVAIFIGVMVGNLASRLFVPNLQSAFNPSNMVPPFKVVFEMIDFYRLYSIVGLMLLLGLGILSYMLSRIRVHQALKLGED
ncbi:ABC transporter permease [Paenibacillus eucommiae]|uniref:ABC transport system permease protein n=1 Tax=Paenibacillus eucommiae TaxID=1355755 RepID=A0ABS4J8Q7_9BACL|nr:ABC transporter permease [Paenibacillus eucommiae]MBP1995456.1 putative ABC transport system permease protein [Paenibacillus eucommiae]